MSCFSNGCRPSVFLPLIACVASLAAPATAEDWPSVTPKPGSAEQRISEALNDDTRLEFIETPFDQVVEFLKDQHDINIELDRNALDDVGIGTDVPITRNLKGICLRSALRIMLKDLDLTYEIHNEVLLITTPEGAVAHARVKVYNVSALLDEGERAESVAVPLMQVLQPTGVPVPASHGGMQYGYSGMMGMGGMGADGFGIGGGMDTGGMGMGGSGIGGAMGDEGGFEEEYPGGEGAMQAAPSTEGARSIMRSARRVVPFKNLLIVRDTTTGHEEFAHVLKCLADALKQDPR